MDRWGNIAYTTIVDIDQQYRYHIVNRNDNLRLVYDPSHNLVYAEIYWNGGWTTYGKVREHCNPSIYHILRKNRRRKLYHVSRYNGDEFFVYAPIRYRKDL